MKFVCKFLKLKFSLLNYKKKGNKILKKKNINVFVAKHLYYI